MKGLIINTESKYEIVTNLPKPTLDEAKTKGERKALVKMLAVSLNRRDFWIGQGLYPGIKLPCILGSDGCGEVLEVSSPQDQYWIGKKVVINPNINWGSNEEIPTVEYRILGMPDEGTFQEYMILNVDRLHEKPSHLSPALASALPLGGLTAFRACVVNGKVKQNSTVLITGIGGGVAQLCLQICVALGARVFVTSSSELKLEKSKKLGAIDGVLYNTKNWDKLLLQKCPERIDVVVDGTAGPDFEKLISVGKLGTRIVVYGATNGAPTSFNIFKLFLGSMKILGSTMGSDKDFKDLFDLVETKKIVPSVDSVRPFELIIDGLEEMRQAKQFGKLVFQFNHNSSKL